MRPEGVRQAGATQFNQITAATSARQLPQSSNKFLMPQSQALAPDRIQSGTL
jgi:hypothetical protein